MMFEKEREGILRANPWLQAWRENWVRRMGFRGPGAKGWARPGVLTVCPDACTLPGRGYSWPGSVSDCTVRGVYLHEIGHVVHASLGNKEAAVLAGLRALGGPRVTGYEPNEMETFAETFRLFAGNPALLEAGRPWRFQFLYSLGIRPPAGRPRRWQRGLVGDPPSRFVEQSERWIERGEKFLRGRSVKDLFQERLL